MKGKLFTRTFAILLALTIATVMVVSPVTASLDIKGIEIDYDAADNEPALLVERTGKPPVRVNGGEFILKGNIKTIADLEEWIQEVVDDFIVTKTPLSQFPADDPLRGDPPEFGEGDSIVGNQVYQQGQYFAIHIFAIDDPETPESELYFWTRFQSAGAGAIPSNWWQR